MKDLWLAALSCMVMGLLFLVGVAVHVLNVIVDTHGITVVISQTTVLFLLLGIGYSIFGVAGGLLGTLWIHFRKLPRPSELPALEED